MSDRPPMPPLPHPWRFSARAWRAGRELTRSRIDLLLRARSAAGLPIDRERFRTMGLADEAVEAALGQVRSLAGWDAAWTRVAQGLLAEARRLGGEERALAAATAKQQAALAYHAAQLLIFDDPKKLRALRSSAVTLFAQSLPVMMPTVTRVEPVWRASTLPGYLVRSERGPRPTPLAVILNGIGTAKEETLLWSAPFLAEGIGVLALDWPGTGETTSSMRITADCDDLTDGVLALAKEDPGLDERRVALVGVDLGGALAVRGAAFDRRIAAAIAVTPPYDAAGWLPLANPVVVERAAALAGGVEALAGIASSFALPGVVERLRCPLLVLGAARDVIVPPKEAVRLARAAGDLGTLLWFSGGGHGLYGAIEEWTGDAARWLNAVLDDPRDPESTLVDPTDITRASAVADALPMPENDRHDTKTPTTCGMT